MKRRRFINITLGSGMAISLAPNLIFGQSTVLESSELLGKGSPTLYGNGFQLRKSAHDAFVKMQAAALKDGIKIHVVSSYRNYAHQKRIWERKYEANLANGLTPIESIYKIIEYSTIPGTSRHHWGTDIDIVDGRFLNTPNLLSEDNFNKDQPFYELKLWLDAHAKSFDFYIVYTNDPQRKGFKYEPWHFSYRPLSCEYLKQYQNLDIFKVIQGEDFKGANMLSDKVIQAYYKEHILDINPELLA